MVVYHNNILCLVRSLAIESGFITPHQWDNIVKAGAKLVKRGMVAIESLPFEIKSQLPAPEAVAARSTFMDHIVSDAKAVTYYSHYLLADGRHLSEAYITEYCTNANVLNAIDNIFTNQSLARKALGGRMTGFWPKASEAINACRDEVKHSLPTNFERLRKSYLKYKAEGYESLISKKFCNDNTLKVTSDIERLLMSIYTMPNKPFAADVYTIYGLFLVGKIQLVDQSTGELFEPHNFCDKQGNPIMLSESTVWNWLNKPANRAVVDSKRNNSFSFNTMHRPHHVRKAPMYSFSKISMDDRDLPRKTTEGGRVKAYYAYDVASGCIVGASYSRTKDEELFLECCRDMFRMIERECLPMPLEVEVENHLVNKFFDDLAIMFPYIRICNPGNSQEKHAEHFNRAKKYGTEKQTQNGIGRWWARSEAYRVDNNKIDNEFVEKVYTYDSLVADDMAAVKAYNNSVHPNKKRFGGRTRWQVLLESVNPNAPQVSKPVVYKSIGERTITTINRNQYCQVQYAKYGLPSIDVLNKLEPNNYTVEAYYLPNVDGIISEVYLYQGQTYLCKAARIEQYSTAKAEWTNDDAQAYTNQAKYVSEFDANIKVSKRKLASIVITDAETVNEINEVAPVVVVNNEPKGDSIDDILADYNPNDYIDQSTNNL
jgi:hypothetical protein